MAANADMPMITPLLRPVEAATGAGVAESDDVDVGLSVTGVLEGVSDGVRVGVTEAVCCGSAPGEGVAEDDGAPGEGEAEGDTWSFAAHAHEYVSARIGGSSHETCSAAKLTAGHTREEVSMGRRRLKTAPCA